MHPTLPRSLLLASVLVLAGCVHQPARLASPGAQADDNLNAVLWMQASQEYRAASIQTWRAALLQLDRALADPHWDALVPSERANPPADLPPAVIVDIDETVLDNSPYQARMVLDGTTYDSGTWAAWVDEGKADAIPGVLEFTRAAQARGVTVFYLSNRTEAQQAPSLANLRKVGLPVAGEHVFLGKGAEVPGCTQASSGDKQCRRQLVGRSHRVLMQFGDQLGDFVEVSDNTPPGRDRLMSEHGDWFGERWWMLPNPTYGDWQPAVFGNDWSLPPQAQRAAKLRALRPAR
ncbi:5'-nucleotidase, lipoprotein e(P4) family [Lysobacter sp. GX 14042]|uniref:5'-nucleotidase, lipoprotein e(P4) family n=1 Tax=Lysobacter sp. GX 14042 TaxID=2907155 RepID=UPI001F46D9E7|nr:5'-nucleotidase, lipoprotein e(P4) family [Lysobacter sp. GX 14042]MCE7032210.1 5'-nucleotidase, lipoprotein e(P4) family [Lysobacter sp. GX 14042]